VNGALNNVKGIYMGIWAVIFGGMGIGAVVSLVFLWTRFQKFGIVGKIAGDKKWLRRVAALFPMLIFIVFLCLDLINTVIVLVHMAIYWALAELIARIIRKLRKKSQTEVDAAVKEKHIYIVGILVLCFELIYFTAGWYLDHHVWETDYQLETTKDLGMENLRIAQVTDSHVCATFDGEGFAEHMKSIQATQPDMLVITGDFVDDNTTKTDMIRSCQALKDFEAPLGKYFIYGNHDKGYFEYRDFTANDLENYLADAGVVILKDQVELINEKIYVVGRKDRSDPDREKIGDIISELDPSKYIIILNHQPNDYEEEAASGADLVLSGHTHGGQMFEINLLGAPLFGSNGRTYGIETRDKTTFIVSSGISDWAIKFKTGTKSEFCIIDLQMAQIYK